MTANVGGLYVSLADYDSPESKLSYSNGWLCLTNSPKPKEIQYNIKETKKMYKSSLTH